MEAIRVLLVEDSSPTRLLLKDYLDRLDGVTVCGEAENGLRGLAQIRALEPDLVLLDLIMPGMDGAGLLDALRREPPPKRPVVVVLSCVSNDEMVNSCIRMGAGYYLLKPVNFMDLARTILTLFPQRQDLGQTGRAGQALWLLGQIMAPERALGTRYAALTAGALAQDPTGRMQLKEAYGPAMAEGGATACNVAKNIRDVIRKIHRTGHPGYHALMGGPPDCCPSNDAFLRRLAQAIQGPDSA